MTPTITNARAMIERLQDEADLCRSEMAEDIAHLLDDAVKVVNGLITLALRDEQDIADAVCDEKPFIQRDALEMAAKLCDEADKSTHPADLADAIRALIPAEANERKPHDHD